MLGFGPEGPFRFLSSVRSEALVVLDEDCGLGLVFAGLVGLGRGIRVRVSFCGLSRVRTGY